MLKIFVFALLAFAPVAFAETKTERLLGEALNEFAFDENGWTHLHWAVVANDVESVRRLLEMGATPSITDKSDKSAFSDRGKQRLKLLGIKGSRYRRNDGKTPLLVAAEFDFRVVATVLIVNGADVNAEGRWGLTPLHWMGLNGAGGLVSILISNGAKVNAKADSGMTPLHMAMSSTEAASLLINGGAEVNAKSNYGETPLHRAASHNSIGAASLLINSGAEVNAKDSDGETPLHTAAHNKMSEMAALLINNGAEVNVKNDDGITPMDIAAIHKNDRETQSILRQNGGRCERYSC